MVRWIGFFVSITVTLVAYAICLSGESSPLALLFTERSISLGLQVLATMGILSGMIIPTVLLALIWKPWKK